jgi:hypothetical protein
MLLKGRDKRDEEPAREVPEVQRLKPGDRCSPPTSRLMVAAEV